jgi:5-methylcytosine-specific restriction endonuclease McrA
MTLGGGGAILQSWKEIMNYKSYLSSNAWKETRARFFNRSQRVLLMRRRYGRIVCEFCKYRGKFNLHHKTYERLGRERTTDLIILCDDCHEKVHSLDKKIPLPTRTKMVRKSTNER